MLDAARPARDNFVVTYSGSTVSIVRTDTSYLS
jgi:hypothetical protein